MLERLSGYRRDGDYRTRRFPGSNLHQMLAPINAGQMSAAGSTNGEHKNLQREFWMENPNGGYHLETRAAE
jgi:hypothetical protein